MQSLMQQRFAGLQALRLRSIIATSEFYSMIGKELPVQEIRFQVVTKGNAYHIVERGGSRRRYEQAQGKQWVRPR